MRAVVYVDGACHPNPGPGGYGVAVIEADGRLSLLAEGYGGAAQTNNRMELAAAIAALALTPGRSVEVRSDSEYVVKGVNDWLAGWKAAGWRAAGGGDVGNRDLWEDLDRALSGRDATFSWVKGHAKDAWNELVDEVAVDAKRARGRLGARVLPLDHVTSAGRARAAKAEGRAARAEARRVEAEAKAAARASRAAVAGRRRGGARADAGAEGAGRGTAVP